MLCKDDSGAFPRKSVLTVARGIGKSSCMFDEELQRMIEEFMARHGMSAATFGIWAMNDSHFVFDLRAGRSCMGKTMRRVMLFMRDYDAKRGNQKNLVSPSPIDLIRKRADSVRIVTTSQIIE